MHPCSFYLKKSIKIINKKDFMQAIILAAGMGKRLGELTRENTKCMIKVHQQTLIDHTLN